MATTPQPVTDSGHNSNNLLLYLVSLFKNVQLGDGTNATFIKIIQHTISFLNNEPRLAGPLQREIARTKNGQEYYFERFVNMDHLNGYYGDGLAYYLQEKRDPQAQIFGHSSLALRYWLTGDEDLFKGHVAKVASYDLQPTMHPYVSGRYFGTMLLHAALLNIDAAVLLDQAKVFHQTLNNQPYKPTRLPMFELIMAMSSNLAGHPAEVLYYTPKGPQILHQPINAAGRQMLQSLHLFKAIALCNVDSVIEAAALYEQIDPSEFYLLSRKFLAIFHSQLNPHPVENPLPV